MQTFLTTTGPLYENLKVLDNKRLHKQALEAWQILMTLTDLNPAGDYRKAKGWKNHPAVLMWEGYESLLCAYAIAAVNEWESRGFKSSLGPKIRRTMLDIERKVPNVHHGERPFWMRDKELYEQITSSHRQALLVKDYSWYSLFCWPEDTGVPPTEYTYVWPVTIHSIREEIERSRLS